MTTVSTTQVNGTLLTWSNQSLLWSDSLSALRAWENSYNTIAYTTAVGESLAFVEVLENAVTKPIAETVAFAEADDRAFGLNQTESFAVLEAQAMSFSQQHEEFLPIGELGANTVTKPLSEAFSIAEADTKHFEMEQFETIDFLEEQLNSVGFIRHYEEAFSVAEAVGKTPHKHVAESFALVDAWRRAADLVISDMMLSQGDMSMPEFEDFMKYGNIPGYTKWRDFIPGDYEYREAMFRVVLESKNDDRGLLTNLQVSVDVPDLLDRGSRTITDANAGAYVPYTRTFHIIPEVTLATRGGTSSNPVVPEFVSLPTITGFTVRLRDTVTGQYVTGSFTWAAHGY